MARYKFYILLYCIVLPANLRTTTRECVHLVTSGHETKMLVTLSIFCS